MTAAARTTTMRATTRRRPAVSGLFLVVLLAFPGVGEAPARAADHDYLTLVLSWSPSYCASDAGRGNESQCGPGRRHAFVVHGLWPQYERGWPEYCDSNERFVPESRIAEMRDIMPSKGLVVHQWRKHGACSGLGQRGYFSAIRELFSRVRIPARYLAPLEPIATAPARLRDDFLKTNAWLKPEMLSVQCGNRRDEARLRELRLCFTRDLAPRACGANERRQCAAASLTLPPVR